MNRFELKETFRASAQSVYDAWLEGDKHAAMTGGVASGSPKVGAAFSAWDGYISGKNVELEEGQRIVQEWRTTEFSEEDESSQVEIFLEEIEEGTELTLIHTNIPDGQSDYESGWKEHYFAPMHSYFGN